MNITLVIIVGLLLLFIAWQQYRHEVLFLAYARASMAPPAYFEPTPAPEREPAPLLWSELFPEEPFELRARVELWEIAPTKVMRPSIHPRFNSYGVDISVAPTIGVC